MGDQVNGWNLTEAEWARLAASVGANLDILEDGAYVRTNASTSPTPSSGGESSEGNTELHFYASALNKPEGWRYAFTEALPKLGRLVASVGRAWHHAGTGFVEFDVQIDAAAQSMTADYEGGVGDFDDATFEQEVERAMRGTPSDRGWLLKEFERLTRVAAE